MRPVSARDAKGHIEPVTVVTDDAPRLDALPQPFGWLIDDSDTLRPWFLAYEAPLQIFVDEYRGRGKRVVTLWADGDSAPRLEAYRIAAERLEAAAIEAVQVMREQQTKDAESVPKFQGSNLARRMGRGFRVD